MRSIEAIRSRRQQSYYRQPGQSSALATSAELDVAVVCPNPLIVCAVIGSNWLFDLTKPLDLARGGSSDSWSTHRAPSPSLIALTVRLPGARMAPTIRTTADCQTRFENSGANKSIRLINSICSKPVMTLLLCLLLSY